MALKIFRFYLDLRKWIKKLFWVPPIPYTIEWIRWKASLEYDEDE